MQPDNPDFAEICTRIENLTYNIMSFWKHPHGWAPPEAADLLNASMLEWQISLATCLRGWLGMSSPGQLILAWANLGALVEGQLKLHLCVHYKDYKKDAEAVRKRGILKVPDECMLEELRQFFAKRIWGLGEDWNHWIKHVQERRNSIHAYKERDIGTPDEWRRDLVRHLSFVRYINSMLPYPEEFAPSEGRKQWFRNGGF